MHEWKIKMNINNVSYPYEIIGDIDLNDILIIADHASNDVPNDIDLGIDKKLLHNHIAVDIGVKTVSEILVQKFPISAVMARQSRLVIDLNREDDNPDAIPRISDTHEITGNVIDDEQCKARLERFHKPYHNKIEEILMAKRPRLILSLHSYTNYLKSDPNAYRPWEIGVLYGEHESTSKQAITLLEQYGLHVGDQLPYSGKVLNYTMDRHAEKLQIPYFGVEMRQDLVADSQGCERFAQILGETCLKITKMLA